MGNPVLSDVMNALLAISLLVCLTGAQAFQEVSSAEYIALTAAEKSEIIWNNVMEDLTPADWFGVLELPGIFTESMCPTIRAPGDELPWEEGIISDGTRYKYIHTVGAVGQVQWVDRGGHSYSGLFLRSHQGSGEVLPGQGALATRSEHRTRHGPQVPQ